jgi:starvation-inducible DNA-binding protein
MLKRAQSVFQRYPQPQPREIGTCIKIYFRSENENSENEKENGNHPGRSGTMAEAGRTTAGATKRESTENSSALAREISADNTPDSPVVQSLRRQAANAIVLYLNYKHYHWQTYGPLFRDLHKLFDRFAKDVLNTLDPIAERVRMIGQDPPAHPLEAIDLASVAQAAPHSTLREMVDEADRNLLIVVKEMRDAVKLADQHGDPGTVDLFSKFVQIHEKHEWWARDILRKGDGLSD